MKQRTPLKGYIRFLIDSIRGDARAIRIIGSGAFFSPQLPENRPGTEMLVALYTNGALGRIRASDPRNRKT